MNVNGTTVLDKNTRAWLNRNNGIRRALNQGGTSSSKTYSILQLLVLIARAAKEPMLISVVSESMPHLKRGAIRDFRNILGADFNERNFNRTEQVYSFGNGVIEFFGADESGKVHGPRRNILFLNEGNNIPWEAAQGLDIRTRDFTFVDWNPVGEFWVHEYDSGGKSVPGWLTEASSAYVHSTYMDALNVLPPEIVEKIEAKRDKDPNWWNVYGLGLLGSVEGLVYPYFTQVPNLPEHGALVYGLDFGFSGDPAVLTKNRIFAEEIYSQELFFESGLTNQDIGAMMTDLGVEKHNDIIWADSAEPKSIEEIYRGGFNIQGAPKGPGSVEYGHQKVRQFKQYWTSDSLNCIKEQRNFRYMPDKNGKLTKKTTHSWSHGMDARRYAVAGYFEAEEVEEVVVYDALAAEAVNMDL